MDVHLYTSKQEKSLLIVDGYTFYEKRRLKSDEIVWQCSTDKKCTAKVYTMPNKTSISRLDNVHFHEKDENLSTKILNQATKRKAEDILERPSEIIHTVIAENPTYLENLTTRNVNNLKQSVYRKRRKHISSLPKNREESIEKLLEMEVKSEKSEENLTTRNVNNLKHKSKRSRMKGLILGVYTESAKPRNVTSLTTAFKEIDGKCSGQLSGFLKGTGPFQEFVKQKLLWVPMLKESIDFDCVSVVDLGEKDPKNNHLENLDQKAENTRVAIASGLKALRKASNFDDIFVDACDNPHCAGEGATLQHYSFVEYKTNYKPFSRLSLYKHAGISDATVSAFERGVCFAECQNFQRHLMEAPANLMTPTIFVSTVSEKLKNTNVKVIVREKEWAKSMKMESFLSVSKGSEEDPKFLELHYNGSSQSEKCIALVGKGVTFDSGGISLKPSKHMDEMRADMGGAACVAATILAASSLKMKVNLKGFIPLCENLPSGKANKPGDVVRAMNGTTIQIDNTDAEGRLILCDALCYAQQFKPLLVVDMATLTGAVCFALGEVASGVYSNDDHFWDLMNKAGFMTGDRVWRMPLFKYYKDQVQNSLLADIINCQPTQYGGSCTAAAFLSNFIEEGVKWIHMDIASVMCTSAVYVPYQSKGMSGRPLRTVAQFVQQLEGEF